jgi:ribonuclease P protein component
VIARSYRLRDDNDVRRTRARGKAVSCGALVARILPNRLEPAQNRYTVIAGKRCGKAVQRNRLKRLVREALRGYHPHLKPGHDIALVCRGTLEEMGSLHAAQETLGTIFTRASLWAPGATPPQPGEPIATGWSAPVSRSSVEEPTA